MRVSIIGNSGLLKGKNQGYLIDEADEIIRLNNAVTKGYEYDVGYRTTARFISMPCSITGEDFESKLKDERLYIIWVNPFITLKHINKVLENNRVSVLSETFLNYCNNLVSEKCFRRKILHTTVSPTKKFASSGMIAICWALDRFEEVNLYGFNFFEGDESNYHYWEVYPSKHHPNRWHDFKKEKEIIMGWKDEGKLKIF